VADAKNKDGQPFFFFFENDSIAADSQPVKILARGEFFDIVFQGLRIFGQYQQFFFNDPLMSPVDFPEIVRSFPQELELIHD
jgi:hypothetical protein